MVFRPGAQGLGFRIWGFGLRVQGLVFRVSSTAQPKLP